MIETYPLSSVSSLSSRRQLIPQKLLPQWGAECYGKIEDRVMNSAWRKRQRIHVCTGPVGMRRASADRESEGGQRGARLEQDRRRLLGWGVRSHEAPRGREQD